MLELSHVSAGYGPEQILRDVSMAFRPGEVLALVGPNGGGKSTLLRTAAGLQPVSGGAVTLDGTPLTALKPREIARKAAFLPQYRSVPDITAWRMVLHGRFPHMGYPRHSRTEDRAAAARALEEADAVPLAGRMLRDLSGGERQKVYLAMALAQEAETLLMDEPTTYLDVAHQLQLASLLRKLAGRGMAVGVVLHDLPLAFRTADRVAVLDGGRVVCTGTPEEVYSQNAVQTCFGVAFRRVSTEHGWQYYCETREG